MENIINTLKPYTKAIVAFIVGVLQILSVYYTLTSDGSLSYEDKNALINAIILAITGTGAVYQLPNAKAARKS